MSRPRLAILALAAGLGACTPSHAAAPANANARAVARMPGLIAFWDFQHAENGVWTSYRDPKAADRAYPLHLKRIGDPKTYTLDDWPYADADSEVRFDDSGPFGRAVRFNKGHVYGAVERKHFDGTPLDLHGKRPFTLIAWAKFVGKRHLVTGIWDEGGWDKYAGRRQVALFAGLFGRKGVIAHVSNTGAASFPQSTAKGSQYARLRAIDGGNFKNNQWVAMATTHDPQAGLVRAYLNGTATPLNLTDPVAQDVYRYKAPQPANPFEFALPIYAPRAFVLKYNGYGLETDGVSEHRLHVDFERRTLTYQRDPAEAAGEREHRIRFNVRRGGADLLARPIAMTAAHGRQAALPEHLKVADGDTVWTVLETRQQGGWRPIGKPVTLPIRPGAPFTFGRALGLGSEELEHGSQLFLDGVAVFDRVLSEKELKALSFVPDARD